MNYPCGTHEDDCFRSDDPDEECLCGAIYEEVRQLRKAIQTSADAALERAAQEAERSVVEFSALDELDTTPERVRIARRIRALRGGG
jgi:hypothetical protein